MLQELDVLQKVHNANIIRINKLLHDKTNYYIVSEVMEGGELFDRVIKAEQFSEAITANVMKQVLLAVNYMHCHKPPMAHRDLKPENILLSSSDETDFDVKVADFGFSEFADPKEKMNLLCGTPIYMAPEIIKKEKYDEKVDIWSIGIITFVLLTGNVPFSANENSDKALKYQICTAEIPFNEYKISENAKDFLKKALDRNTKQRASASDLLNTKFIKEC